MCIRDSFQDEGASYGMSYVPWWFWYAPGYGASGGVMPNHIVYQNHRYNPLTPVPYLWQQ